MAERKKRKSAEEKKKEVLEQIDVKIAYHEGLIEKLKARKENILNPRPTQAAQLKGLIAKAQEQGLSTEEIAEKLGITL